MSSLNSCIFIGRVSRIDEPKFGDNGVSLFSFGLAVDKFNKKKLEAEGKVGADFFTIKTFGKTATFLYDRISDGVFSKGLMLCVEARAGVNEWVNKEGEKRSIIEFIGNNVTILVWPKKED